MSFLRSLFSSYTREDEGLIINIIKTLDELTEIQRKTIRSQKEIIKKYQEKLKECRKAGEK